MVGRSIVAVLLLILVVGVAVSVKPNFWQPTQLTPLALLSSGQVVYRVAFLLIDLPDYPTTQRQIQILQGAINLLPNAWAEATTNLASIDASGPFTVHLTAAGDDDSTAKSAAKVFYASNPDAFDFLIMTTTYGTAGNPHFLIVSNDMRDIGLGLFNWGQDYGSSGRLQGVAWFGPADLGDPVDAQQYSQATLTVHELGHRWSAYVDFMDNGVKSFAMTSAGHWSQFLNTGGSTMHGWNWRDNGDGTFTALPRMKGTSYQTTYGLGSFPLFCTLDLYLQGLIAANEVPPTLLVVPTTSLPDTAVYDGVIVNGIAKTIIVVEGSGFFTTTSSTTSSSSAVSQTSTISSTTSTTTSSLHTSQVITTGVTMVTTVVTTSGSTTITSTSAFTSAFTATARWVTSTLHESNGAFYFAASCNPPSDTCVLPLDFDSYGLHDWAQQHVGKAVSLNVADTLQQFGKVIVMQATDATPNPAEQIVKALTDFWNWLRALACSFGYCPS